MQSVKRPRQEQAAATRQRILDTAYALFCELGYRGTTMALIADRAGVAVQTVYFTFRTKDALLQEVYNQTVTGRGTPVVPPEQPWFRAMADEPEPAHAVHHLVQGAAEILARVSPILPVFQSVMSEPAGMIHRNAEALRRQAMHDVARLLLAKGEATAALGPDDAGDLLILLTGPEAYRTLVLELGWTPQHWIDWTAQALVRELFRPDQPSRPSH